MGSDSILFLIPIGIGGFLLLVIFLARTVAKQRAEWQRFADSVGATMEKGRFGARKIVAPDRQWSVTIDTYTESHGESSTLYTRLLRPYAPTRPFYFLLQPRSRTPRFVEKMNAKAAERVMAKLTPDQRACFELTVRGEEISFGDSDLDGRFMLRATDPELARRLFGQPALRRLLAEQKGCTLSLKPPDMDKRLGNKVPALGYVQVGMLPTAEALRSAYDLMVSVIEEMNREDLAVPAPPGANSDTSRLLAGR